MIFRQLLDPSSCTYTYILSCPDTGVTVLIDPVLESIDRDQHVLQQLGLKLTYTLETHVHADHITSATKLKQLTGSKIVYPQMDNLPCADSKVKEGEVFRVGNIELHPLFTPGHTDHHHAYLIDNGFQKIVFTGDALLIDGCGRTDFQSGSSEALYRSIHSKLFTLPDETLVYPGHDYDGRFVSSVGQEKERNPRLGNGKSLEQFVGIMDNLKIPKPRNMHYAVPGNMQCGVCTENTPEDVKPFCED
jgi:sulfur dioxygenase